MGGRGEKQGVDGNSYSFSQKINLPPPLFPFRDTTSLTRSTRIRPHIFNFPVAAARCSFLYLSPSFTVGLYFHTAVGRPVPTRICINLHTPRGYRIVRTWFGVPRWVVFLLSLKGCKGRLVLAVGGAEEEEPPLLHFFLTILPSTHPLANAMSSFKFILYQRE